MIPLPHRQQAQHWDDSAAAIGRLMERCERLEHVIHQQDRATRRLRDALITERQHNTVLRARLTMQRTRKRRKFDPGQLALSLG